MNLPPKLSRYVNAWSIAAVVLFVIDRVCKYVALRLVSFGDQRFFIFKLFNNYGIAFSLPLPPAIFWPIATVIFALLVVLFVRAVLRAPERVGPYLMVLLGALSNLLDRHYRTSTTDYLIFFNRSAINIADIMIVAALAKLCFATKPKHLEEKSA